MQSLSLRCDPVHVDGHEGAGDWIRRLINESPIVVLSRKGCFMCHVMRHLLTSIGAHPSVIELEEAEASVAAATLPALFVGGNLVGGLEGLVGLHLSGALVPRLVQAGAIGSY
ncbi:Glutaredoxin [Rhynchospora pubera]|uniref:Glutaredoxin n=1 Tax=Rhynchospora pubera TaxID=906938 RepID=A0AAV8GTN9_9POAL|nr:Glutaredoxin [Rhynchospora pubera]